MGRIAGAALAPLLLLLLLLLLLPAPAQAAERRGIRFWNLTLHTLTSLQFSPPGQNAWGKNQCENDNDKTVDHDERLRITGIKPGRYDAKFSDKMGRTCVVKDVEVKDGVFAIEEKQLTNCEQK
jgi:hypothetical protein